MTRPQIGLVAFSLFLAAVVYAADSRIAEPLFEAVKSAPLGDKLCHFLFTAVLTALANRAFPAPAVRARTRIPVATLVVALVVVVEELSQQYFPSRTFSLGDLTADALGIALGTLVALRG